MEKGLHHSEIFYNKAEFEDLSNPVGKECVLVNFTDELQGALVAKVEPRRKLKIEDDSENIYSVERARKDLTLAHVAMEEMRPVKSAVRKEFYNCQKGLRLQKISFHHQSTILDYFEDIRIDPALRVPPLTEFGITRPGVTSRAREYCNGKQE